MQTMKLFAYQRPSRVAALLDSLLQTRSRLPSKARKITDRSELPSALQKIVIRSRDTERVWSAWSDEDRIWFFTAEMSLELSRERGCPAIQVGLYGMDGALKSWQLWAWLNDGTCSNAHCERGDYRSCFAGFGGAAVAMLQVTRMR